MHMSKIKYLVMLTFWNTRHCMDHIS